MFKVLAFVVFIGLADSYGVPWFKHSHDDCNQNYPHFHPQSPHGWNQPPSPHGWNHPPSPNGWNHPPSPRGWNWHPWHGSGPHVVTTYTPVVVYDDVHIDEDEPTTTEEVVTEPPPQGAIESDSEGSGIISLSPAEEDNSAASAPPPTTTEAPVEEEETTSTFKVQPYKPDFYQKHIYPVYEGKYIAKTLGSVHIAPLQGHANSVTVLNAEPAPGTI